MPVAMYEPVHVGIRPGIQVVSRAGEQGADGRWDGWGPALDGLPGQMEVAKM